jgi:hypothetical protein
MNRKEKIDYRLETGMKRGKNEHRTGRRRNKHEVARNQQDRKEKGMNRKEKELTRRRQYSEKEDDSLNRNCTGMNRTGK